MAVQLALKVGSLERKKFQTSNGKTYVSWVDLKEIV